MIALFGSKGYVGSAILSELKKSNYEVLEITRENFEENLGKEFEYVINAAMPSSRFWAKNNPLEDFKETIEKTSRIFYETRHRKFIHISSISARCQIDTIYGRHKLAAESIVNDGESLIVRLGPMFSESLKKGVLIDMLSGSRVYVGRDSRYAFAPLEFVGRWVVDNLEKKGIHEVGARDSISLSELAAKLGLSVSFEGPDSHQEIKNPLSDFPSINEVINFMRVKIETNGKKNKEM